MFIDNIVIELAVIFAGASVLATIFLYLKQPVIISYIVLGMIIGPWGVGILESDKDIEGLAHFGVILLLFLLGLHLQPKKLVTLFKKTSLLTMGTSFSFFALAATICLVFQFSLLDSAIVGSALMFSSTVVSLKLIPTTTLHHKHKGEMMTSVLLFQDILAIILILFLTSKSSGNVYVQFPVLLLKIIGLAVAAFVLVKMTILPLFRKFDVIQEYIFLVSLGWCLSMAEAAMLLGLSYEMGAFVAGISIASSPIAWVISEKLKPLREFFLILFFFSIGSKFDYLVTQTVLVPGIIIALILLVGKPFIFKFGFSKVGESPENSIELGMRLGQASEFSLLLAASAVVSGKLTNEGAYLIQLVTIITFIISTYAVILKYPTPISPSSTKRAD